MRVFHHWEDIQPHVPTSITVGSFDGIHLGHRQLIDRLLALAREHDLVGTVVTFEPHPKKVLGKGDVHLLTDIDEKLELLKQLNIEQTLVIPFTRDFARMDYRHAGYSGGAFERAGNGHWPRPPFWSKPGGDV